MLLTEEMKKERWELAYAGKPHVPKNMRRATMALFWERRHNCHWKKRNITPLFSLSMEDKEQDGYFCPSFPQLYFQCDSDYEAAMVILGSWKHWELLVASEWFAELLEQWKDEKERRDHAFATGKIKELAKNGNLSALKYIQSGGLTKTATGKPTKKPKPEAEDKSDTPVKDSETDSWLEHGMSLLEDDNES